ncbi:hypothetical protein [Demequina flava]|uniref:hypothetical protein n=1 Tax=Demequina flava TaxID=1095025 RepID=UPI000784BED5|nr:hypothetical protein [Demequina flava]
MTIASTAQFLGDLAEHFPVVRWIGASIAVGVLMAGVLFDWWAPVWTFVESVQSGVVEAFSNFEPFNQ